MGIYDRIIANGGLVCYNSKAVRVSPFKTGGIIDLLMEPSNRDGLIAGYEMLGSEQYSLYGGFTNVLIDDSGIRGTVLSTKRAKGATVEGNGIDCLAGDTLMHLSVMAKSHGLSGLEGLSGIPGTIGGGIAMNCGAYGTNMADILDSVDVFYNGKVLRLYNQQLGFGYRDSIFRHYKLPIIGCRLALVKNTKVSITDKMQELTKRRLAMQPIEPSLGCVFKKVGTESAGVYIEGAGLKGMTRGGAIISPKHANFIVNNGGATSDDYKFLAEYCQKEVEKLYGIKLEREVIFSGEERV